MSFEDFAEFLENRVELTGPITPDSFLIADCKADILDRMFIREECIEKWGVKLPYEVLSLFDEEPHPIPDPKAGDVYDEIVKLSA